MQIAAGSLGMYSLLLSNQYWLERLGSTASAYILSFGGVGIMLLAILDSSFFSVPEGNDLLIIVLSAGGTWGHMAYFVSVTILGSVIGCLLLYSIGRKGGSPILRRRFSPQGIERAEKMFTRYGALTVVIPSILPPPMPFKVFVLSAGVFRLNRLTFFMAVVVGRTIRYSIWGILAVLYGDSAKVYMQQSLGSVGMMIFIGFALVMTAAVTFFLHRSRKKEGEMPD